MSVVIDSSIALNWVMPDEDSSHTEALMDSVSVNGATVPPLFHVEMGNSLLVGVRRRRISADYVSQALDLVGRLPLSVDNASADHVWSTTIEIAAAYGLTLYDATYLESALRLELPLATLDARLARAAKIAGVSSPWSATRN
ncbi:MAG: type II toxin-antitoxin system VapC family toxin [Rhizobiaceae bacterium]|nr:type II toxin-antitoxin system VapC family toxin [Rhizobiaceae bacterium]